MNALQGLMQQPAQQTKNALPMAQSPQIQRMIAQSHPQQQSQPSSMAPMQPQPPIQSQSTQQGQPIGYSGVVSYKGKQIQVKNGQGEFGGERFIVSDDGRIVANDKGQFVGIIQNGQFVMATPEITEQLKQQGAFSQ